MIEPEIAFTTGDAAELDRVVEALAERFTIAARSHERRRLYYDTFDWRLWRRRGRLWRSPSANGARLTWHTERQPEPLRFELPGAGDTAEIGFAADLPAGRVRDRLEAAISVRRLLPVVEIRAQGRTLQVLGADRQAVARLIAEVPLARPPGSLEPGESLAPILIVQRVEGHPEVFREIVGWLRDELGLEEWAADELDAGAALGGRGAAGSYSSKLKVPLARSTAAAPALRAVLRQLLETIEANHAGTLADLDTEFLHDFRVAVRRTRSLLSLTRGVWGRKAIAPYRSEFSWLGRATGLTRDLDVFLIALPGYTEALPEGVRADVEPLRRQLEAMRAAAHSELAAQLGGSRYRRLIEAWHDFLEAPPARVDRRAKARQPVLAVANKVIGKAHRRVLERGGRIGADSPPEALHRLRIDCKKLRYALEFFRSLYAPQAVAGPIRALKQLQDHLGAFNDYGVQRHTLAQLDGGTIRDSGLTARDHLAAELAQGEAQERARFSARFAEFAAEDTTADLRRLLSGAD